MVLTNASLCKRPLFMTGTKRTVKVAIIGSGLAGITAAFLLLSANHESSDVEFEVHIFEKVCNGKLSRINTLIMHSLGRYYWDGRVLGRRGERGRNSQS